MPDTATHPKIYTWTLDKPDALATNRFATVWEARKSRAALLGVPVTDVMGRRA